MNDRLTGKSDGKPYLYAVLAPLFIVILLSIATVFISVNYGDRPVADAFSKDGLNIQADSSAEQEALKLGVGVTLLCDDVSIKLVLEATNPEFIHPDELLLSFVHRADARLDRHYNSGRIQDNIYHLGPELTSVFSGGAGRSPGYWQVRDTSGRWLLRMDNPVCVTGDASSVTGLAEGLL